MSTRQNPKRNRWIISGPVREGSKALGGRGAKEEERAMAGMLRRTNKRNATRPFAIGKVIARGTPTSEKPTGGEEEGYEASEEDLSYPSLSTTARGKDRKDGSWYKKRHFRGSLGRREDHRSEREEGRNLFPAALRKISDGREKGAPNLERKSG